MNTDKPNIFECDQISQLPTTYCGKDKIMTVNRVESYKCHVMRIKGK